MLKSLIVRTIKTHKAYNLNVDHAEAADCELIQFRPGSDYFQVQPYEGEKFEGTLDECLDHLFKQDLVWFSRLV